MVYILRMIFFYILLWYFFFDDIVTERSLTTIELSACILSIHYKYATFLHFCDFSPIFSKSCNTCRRTITADSPGLSHGDFHWHACPHCFSCSGCGSNLINQQFLLKDGQLFCSVDCKQRTMLSWTQNGLQNLHIHWPNATVYHIDYIE